MTEPCAIFAGKGGIDPSTGYGRLTVGGVRWRAHRYAWTVERGPIPDGLVVHHVCGNKLCVNPSHMELVTPGEHILRPDSTAGRERAKTHCPHGHPYSRENTFVRPNGGRFCRECGRIRMRAYKRRKE